MRKGILFNRKHCIIGVLVLTIIMMLLCFGAAAQNVTLTYLRKFNLGFLFNVEEAPFQWNAAGSEKAGIIVAYDPAAHKMRIYDKQGKQLRSFGAAGMLPGQFTWPSGIYVDDAGNIYVADVKIPTIRKYDQFGKMLIEYKLVSGASGWMDVSITGNTMVASPDSFTSLAKHIGVTTYRFDNKQTRQIIKDCWGQVAIGPTGNILAYLYEGTNEESKSALKAIMPSGKVVAQLQYDGTWIVTDVAYDNKMNGLIVVNKGMSTVDLYDQNMHKISNLYKPKEKGYVPIAAIHMGDELYIVHTNGEVFVYRVKITTK